MPTPIAIVRLRAYAGPNIHGPQPGVLLQISAPTNYARRLRDAIRDGAQAIGMVIAYLETEAHPRDTGFLIEARFTSGEPPIAADLCRFIVDGICAEADGNEEWNRDEPLVALQARYRAAAMPVAALQLRAEARSRGLPWLALPSGRLQIGYGACGWQYDPQADTAPSPPWSQLGSIPLTLVSGWASRSTAVAHYAAQIAAIGMPVRSADGLDFEGLRDLLSDPSVEAAVVGLDSQSLIMRGLPVDRCDHAVICDLAGPRPPAAADDEEWLRALGLPMFLSPNPVQINLADARLHPLIPYAPNGVINAELSDICTE
ncbi:MAG: DUF4938 domain-containing protein [Oscillochloris sp.]|nr:DUF4938 domain-containing protein [Oscillochloris sp.]